MIVSQEDVIPKACRTFRTVAFLAFDGKLERRETILLVSNKHSRGLKTPK